MTNISRRKFLATGAAAAVAPLILPQGVLGRAGRPGANDRITLGFIGVGGQGRHVMRSMKRFAQPVALCDVNREHLDAVTELLDQPVDRYGDYRRILDRADIDAVVIATPDHWHAVQTIHACEAGKDIYVEKPLCNTIHEGRAVLRAIERYGRVVQVGAQGRSMPVFRKVCNFVRNGELGRVERVDCWHYENRDNGVAEDSDPPDYLDWDMWLGPARWVPHNRDRWDFTFRWFLEYGGGNVRDRGAHIFSLVHWFLELGESGPVRVSATGTPPAQGNFDCPTKMDVTWEFENPSLTVTWRQPGDPPEGVEHGFGAVYQGTQDTLTVEGGDGGGGVASEEVMEYEPPAGGYHAPEVEGHHQNWIECIRTRETPITDAWASHRVASMCILANLAYRLGRPLDWDPVAERFVNDAEANRFLSEPARSPWIC